MVKWYRIVNRSIIHLNIADFAVAVEINIQPSLKGYPLIVAPAKAPRAVVYDMSEEAYQQGIRKGMPLARARRFNKKIKILPPDFNRYERAMRDLLKHTFTFTPRIEAGRFDGHIFMDVTGSSKLFGPSADIAFKLKKKIKKNFNFDPAWSVATNKLIAKVATRVVKPAGEHIVAPGDEKKFLAPLPVHIIPGFIKTDLIKLREFNLFSVSQVRTLTVEQLKIPFLQKAPEIYDRIRGIDSSPVAEFDENSSSIYADFEFSDDTNDISCLKQALYLMVEKICKNLRDRKFTGAAAKMIVFYSDGVEKTAKSKFSPSTSNETAMFEKCFLLLDKVWTRRVRIRHIRLICDKFSTSHVQESLFDSNSKMIKQAHLIRAIDRIREKFGSSAIRTGLTLAPLDNLYQHAPVSAECH